MSSYAGAEGESGRNQRWSSYVYNGPSGVSTQAASGFTPINQEPIEFVKPVEPPPCDQKSMDDYQIWNLPEDKPHNQPKTKAKRSAISQASGRSVSLGKTWVYTPDDQHQYHDGAREAEKPPKRRKVAATERSKSAKAAVKRLTSLLEDQEADKGVGDQVSETTKSSKPTKTRKPKETKMGPFKNPVITKLVPSGPGKEPNSELKSLNMPTISRSPTFHGFQTSEQKLHNGLTQTTMGKLAAFRFKPTSVKDVTPNRKPSPFSDCVPVPMSQVPSGAPFEHSQHSESMEHLAADDHGSDCVPLPASWPSEDNLNVSNVELLLASQEHKNTSLARKSFTQDDHAVTNDVQGDASHQHNYVETAAACLPQVNLPPRSLLEPALLQGVEADVHMDEQPLPQTLPSSHGAEFGEPTSSELEAMADLADIIPDVAGETPPAHTSDEVELPNESSRTDVATIAIDTLDAGPESLSDYQIEMEAFEEVELPEESPFDLEWLENSQRQYLIGVQVDHPHVDEVHAIHKHVPQHYDDDEFDDGLDDSDFLALASDSVTPQTQWTSPVDTRNDDLHRSKIISPHTPAAGMTSLAENIDDPMSECAGVVFAEDRTSDVDDEYHMDEDDEAEMCKLDDRPRQITAQSVSSQSVQDEFGGAGSSEYDSRLQFSPPKPMLPPSSRLKNAGTSNTDQPSDICPTRNIYDPEEEEDWSFIQSRTNSHISPATPTSVKQIHPTTLAATQPLTDLTVELDSPEQPASSQANQSQPSTRLAQPVLDDSHEYQALHPFARPDFPDLVSDRSPIVGVSLTSFLRVCFRIGEMMRQGAIWSHQEAMIELYARVTFSSREVGTTKQHFQFADMWHDRPPFPNGVLMNFKMSGLVESESRVFVGAGEGGVMARTLGNLKRDGKGNWMLNVINIRPTDWEEIRWTKRIMSAPLTMDGI